MGGRTGWFDAFREHGAPTWYGDNRTPVVTDTVTLGICLSFAVVLFSFLIVLPGLRRKKLDSLLSVLLMSAVGAVILTTLFHPGWHVAETPVHAPFRAFYGAAKLHAVLALPYDVGSTPIEEQASSLHLSTLLDYNERFDLQELRSMQRELAEALRSGQPFPILTVIEYMSVDRAGFVWGRQYRLAGYYTSILLWHCIALWALALCTLCLCSQYFSRFMCTLGAALVFSAAVYVVCVRRRLPLLIRFPPPSSEDEAQTLSFALGWCFWATLAAGLVSLLYGCVLRILELKVGYKLTSFLEPGFDRGFRRQRGSLMYSSANGVSRSVSQQKLGAVRGRHASGTALAAHRLGASLEDEDLVPIPDPVKCPVKWQLDSAWNCPLVVTPVAAGRVRSAAAVSRAPQLSPIADESPPTALAHWRLGNACDPRAKEPYAATPPTTEERQQAISLGRSPLTDRVQRLDVAACARSADGRYSSVDSVAAISSGTPSEMATCARSSDGSGSHKPFAKSANTGLKRL